MSDVIRIKLHVGTGFSGAKHEDIVEFPRVDWEQMTESQREELLDELATDFRNDVIDCNAWVMEDEE